MKKTPDAPKIHDHYRCPKCETTSTVNVHNFSTGRFVCAFCNVPWEEPSWLDRWLR